MSRLSSFYALAVREQSLSVCTIGPIGTASAPITPDLWPPFYMQ